MTFPEAVSTLGFEIYCSLLQLSCRGIGRICLLPAAIPIWVICVGCHSWSPKRGGAVLWIYTHWALRLQLEESSHTQGEHFAFSFQDQLNADGTTWMPYTGALTSSSSGDSHVDVAYQTVQATSTPVAAQRHHTLPCSRLLDTSAGHKVQYPTARVPNLLMGPVPHDYGRLYMLDLGRTSGFFLLLDCNDAPS